MSLAAPTPSFAVSRLVRRTWTLMVGALLLRGAGAGVTIGCAAAMTFLLLQWMVAIPLPRSTAWWLVALGGVAGAAAPVLLGHLPRTDEVARRIDRHFGLRDRVSTALALNRVTRLDPGFATLVVDDAQRVVRGLAAHAVVPRRVGVPAVLAAPALVLVTVAWLWLPARVPSAASSSTAGDTARQTDLNPVEAARSAARRDLDDVIRSARDGALPASSEQLEQLERLAEQLEQPIDTTAALARVRDSAADTIDEMAERLAAESSAELDAVDAAAQRFTSLPRREAPLHAEAIDQALREGRFEDAADAIRALTESAGGLTTAEREALARHFEALARDLDAQAQGADAGRSPRQAGEDSPPPSPGVGDEATPAPTGAAGERDDDRPPADGADSDRDDASQGEDGGTVDDQREANAPPSTEGNASPPREPDPWASAFRDLADRMREPRAERSPPTGSPSPSPTSTSEPKPNATREPQDDRNGERLPPQQEGDATHQPSGRQEDRRPAAGRSDAPVQQPDPRREESQATSDDARRGEDHQAQQGEQRESGASGQQQQQQQQQQQRDGRGDPNTPTGQRPGQRPSSGGAPSRSSGEERSRGASSTSRGQERPGNEATEDPGTGAPRASTTPDGRPRDGAASADASDPSDQQRTPTNASRDAAGERADEGGADPTRIPDPAEVPNAEQLVRELAKRQSSARDRGQQAQDLRERARRLLERSTPEERDRLQRWADLIQRERGSGAGAGDAPGAPFDGASRRIEPHRIEDVQLTGQDPGGEVIADWLSDLPQQEGATGGAAGGQRLPQRLDEARRAAERAVDDAAVPPHYHPLLRRYFDQLAPAPRSAPTGAGHASPQGGSTAPSTPSSTPPSDAGGSKR